MSHSVPHPLPERLGLRVPIIQAPMAGVSSPAMAAAVSNSGGLGSLGVGAMQAGQAQAAIREFRGMSDGPLNVNVFVHRAARRDPSRENAWLERLRPEFARCHAEPPRELHEIYTSFLDDAAMLAVLIEERPAAVSFHFGLPHQRQVEMLHAAGIHLLASATNVREARSIEAAGIDAIIAQGYEAGGHRGVFDPDGEDNRMGTLALTRLLVGATGLPVIAAGGIMDGAGIAAVLALGACAAQLGTAFVGTTESLADAAYRERLFGEPAHHTVMTRVISGRPARCLANDFTRWGESLVDDCSVPDYPIAYDAGKALNGAGKAAARTGYGAQWAGQGAPLARELPARDLMAALEIELAHALRVNA